MLIKRKQPDTETQQQQQQQHPPITATKRHNRTNTGQRQEPKKIPENILTAKEMPTQDTPKKIPVQLLAVFLLLTMVMIIAGIYYYRFQKNDLKKRVTDEMLAIADLKTNQIVNWRQERLSDAATIRDNALLAPYIQELIADPKAAKRKKELITWIKTIKGNFQYDDILVIARNGLVMLSAAGNNQPLADQAMAAVAQAVKTARTVIADLYKDTVTDKVHLDIAAPVLNEARDDVLCVFLLRVDPNLFLFPLIEAWPTPSYSAETMLVRQEGNDILYLNNVRHQKGSALTLRLPSSQRDLPAALATKNNEGIVEGIDYRGIAVLAALKTVPDTPWHIVAKIDRDEIYSPTRNELWTVMMLIGLSIFSACAAIVLIWHRFGQQAQKAYNAALRVTVKQRTAELEQMNIQLKEFNNDLESFSYSVSHDLRQPLISIEGFSKRLLKKQWEKLDENGREDASVINQEAQKMNILIDDILGFCRASTSELHKEAIDMDAMARNIADQMAAAVGDRAIRFEIDELPVAHGDSSMIRQVMTNLLSNAVKYTRPRTEAIIEVGTIAHNNANIYYVKDNGVGFDGNNKGNLFTLFKRLHSADDFEGTGIGLVIIKRIINKHGGQVWAEGKVDEGATFYFSLPHNS